MSDVTEQPQSSFLQETLTPIFNAVGWEAIALLILFLFLILTDPKKKGELASGRLAKGKEKRVASQLARQQMRTRKRNQVSLYFGTPQQTLLSRLLHPKTLYIPEAQEGIAIAGAPGKGKTFSMIDPLIRSAIDQAFPVVVYAYKEEQLHRHAAYAAKAGYDVRVFAPGKPYSEIINPEDFLTDESDANMAQQLAIVLNRNASSAYSSASSSSADYFSKSADLLIQSLLMLAKSTIYPDLLMAWAILRLPNLAKRLQLAQQDNWLDLWAEPGATSLASVADAPQTAGGITSTANKTFAPLISREFVSSLCGQTTIPLNLEGKRILFFHLDQERRDAIAPLLASILHLTIVKNLASPRKDPLILVMDELPTLYLPDLVKWINEYRENGLVTILGYQNHAQLEHKYGKELTRSILGACATKVIFNPQDKVTAEEYEKYFGEEEIIIKSKSRSFGKNRGRSQSEQHQKRPLISARQLNTLPKGKCVFVNPAYGSEGEAALPQILSPKIPQADLIAQKNSEQLWEEKVRARLIERAQRSQISLDPNALRSELQNRFDVADSLFPVLPEEVGSGFDFTAFNEDKFAALSETEV
ncbi:MAG: type IV secretion system DNA-binding domain-containing protein [Cyanobacteria bacterium]|jgi:type IV secretory pathway TraG/TraD family ATPase VirD4|nr:type IV secretion system DNA-binding domain-containing protein [Cyanobacteria bacterium GSL.Bin21]